MGAKLKVGCALELDKNLVVKCHHTVKGGNRFVCCTPQDGGCVLGTGNIIMGYNSGNYSSTHFRGHKKITGNHNLIMGVGHTISGSDNIVTGDTHMVQASNAVADRGSFNTIGASGTVSAIVAGMNNKVTTHFAIIIAGGGSNTI